MRNILTAILVVCFGLTGCGGITQPPVVPNVLGLAAQDWNLQFSSGVLSKPIDGISPVLWYFDFPTGSGTGVNYVDTPYISTEDLYGKTLTMTFEVVSDDPVYGLEDPATYPPISLHLFLQRQGDNYTAVGEYQYYRWWCADSQYVLGSADNTVVTVSCPLVYTSWSSVYSATDQTDFQATLDNLQDLGFTLGGSAGWGHGVNLESGTARFELLGMQLQ